MFSMVYLLQKFFPPIGGYIYLTPLGVDGPPSFGIFWESQHLTTAANEVICNPTNCSGNTGASMPKVGEQIAKGEKRLTPPQQKFLDNYIHKDMTQTAAAREAGYKNANVSAVQLLNNPKVKERMEEMRQELEAKYGVSITKSVRDMQRLRDEAWQEGNFGAAIKAEELRLKVTGLMVARSHVTHEHIDNLSREQIVEQLQEFMDRAKNRMIDVTPAENPTEPEQNPITDYNQQAAE